MPGFGELRWLPSSHSEANIVLVPHNIYPQCTLEKEERGGPWGGGVSGGPHPSSYAVSGSYASLPCNMKVNPKGLSE